MKTFYTLTALALVVAFSGAVQAEGSKIQKSTLINASKNTGNLNAAIGKGSRANTGSISVKGSKIQKSTVINASKNTGNLNAAIGKNSTANTGSIDIQ